MKQRILRLCSCFEFILAVLFATCNLSAGPSKEIRLQEYQEIIIPSPPPDSVILAASELQKYIKSVTGAQLPIMKENKKTKETPVIYLGTCKKSQKAGLFLQDFRPDEFRIKTFHGDLFIAGHDYCGQPLFGLCNPFRFVEVWNPRLKIGAFGETGTLYGVYYFLEKYLGIRWYMPGSLGEVIPKNPDVKIPAMDIRRYPAFSYRYAWFCDFSQSDADSLWYRRAGFGAIYPIPIIHSFAMFLKYKDSHSEYFALRDGGRDFTRKCASRGGHLCLSNPKVALQWKHDIEAYFKNHPEVKIFPIVPNDGLNNICECPNCQSDADNAAGNDGKFSDHIWKFVDKVAQMLDKKYSDRYIGCIAYNTYSSPPKAIRKLSDNIIVMICKNRSMFSNPKAKEKLRKRINDWTLKSKNIVFWDYYLHHQIPWRNLPVFFPGLIKEDIQYMKSIASNGEFIQAESWTGNEPHCMRYPGMQHLNLYLTGKLYWEPSLDIPSTLNEYYNLFYGPAGTPMKKFWELSALFYSEAFKNIQKCDIGVPKTGPGFSFTRKRLDQLAKLLAKAETLTPENSVYHKRIKLIATEFYAGRRSAIRQIRKESPLIISRKVDRKTIIAQTMPQQFVDKCGETPTVPTWVYSTWDNENLYLLFICFEPNPAKIRTTISRRDKNFIWNDDNIEIFIGDPTLHSTRYFHFIVNAKGVIWDAVHKDKTSKSDTSWNSRIKAQTNIEINRWILNISIPFQDIGIKNIKQLPALNVNFYRTRAYSGGVPDYSCWAPVFINKHFSPERFGRILLKEEFSSGN